MNLIDELNETIKTLEDKIPANPASGKNEHIEKGLQKSLADYFRDLNNALDWNKLEHIYYRNVKTE
jgi:hypothetical protein